MKSEPGDYCFSDLERDGGTVWDGVGNNLALMHMREVREGDLAFVYHTGKERAIVGLARVTSDPYPDPRSEDPSRVVFDVEPLERLPQPVTLATVKGVAALAGWELVRNPRLSVMPVARQAWDQVLEMADRQG